MDSPTNTTRLEDDRMLMSAFLLLISFTGSLLNIILLFFILSLRLFRTTNNLYIMNLAFADLIIAMSIILFPIPNFAFRSWPLGSLGCRVMEIIRDISTSVSLFTLTAMSYDRYHAIHAKQIQIRSPHTMNNFRLTTCITSRSGFTLLLVWVAAGASYLPTFFFLRHGTTYGRVDSDAMMCLMDKKYEIAEPKELVLVFCLLTYVIPIAVICYNYGSIVVKLLSVAKKMPKTGGSSLAKSRLKAKQRAKSILCLVLAFLICSLPRHLFFWIYYFASDHVHRHMPFWNTWRTVGFYLYYLYPILNTAFLFTTSDQYRGLFNKYLFRCWRRTDHENTALETEMSSRPAIASNIESGNTESLMAIYSGDGKLHNQNI